jgi:hypothetical protein
VSETPPIPLRDPSHLPEHLRQALSGRRDDGRPGEPGSRGRPRTPIVAGAAVAAGLVGAAAVALSGLWPL